MVLHRVRLSHVFIFQKIPMISHRVISRDFKFAFSHRRYSHRETKQNLNVISPPQLLFYHRDFYKNLIFYFYHQTPDTYPL